MQGALPGATRGVWPRRLLLGVLAVALIVRLCALYQFADVDTLRGDEVYYTTVARAIAAGAGHPGSLRPPLYPTMVAAVLAVAGDDLLAVRVVQILLSLCTVVCVFHVCRRRFGLAAAGVSGLLCAVSPGLVHYSHFLWSEGLNALLVAILFVLLDRVDRRADLPTIVGAGLVLGLLALTRETWLYFVPIVALWIFLGQPGAGGAGAGSRTLAAGALLVGTVIIVVPWAIRNQRVQGEAVLISTNRWFPIAMGNLYPPESWFYGTPGERARGYLRRRPGADEGEGSQRVGAKRDAPVGATELERDRYWKGVALTAIGSEQPWWIVKKIVRNVAFLLYANTQELRFLGEGWVQPSRLGAVTLVATSLAGYLLTVVPGFAAFWLVVGDRLKPLAVLAVLQVAAVHILANANPRFLVPVLPLLALYAGPVMSGSLTGARLGWWRWAGAGATVAVCTVLPALPSRLFLSVLWSRVQMLAS